MIEPARLFSFSGCSVRPRRRVFGVIAGPYLGRFARDVEYALRERVVDLGSLSWSLRPLVLLGFAIDCRRRVFLPAACVPDPVVCVYAGQESLAAPV